jgi:hypothetical protein
LRMDAKEGPMPFYASDGGLSRRFHLILSSFLQQDGLAFAKVLPEQAIEQAFADAEVDFATEEGDVYTPALTLWAFLSQSLAQEALRSCKAAVARVIVLLVTLGKVPCSDNTSAYCRARAKLPVTVLRRLTTDVADGCEQRLPKRWLWKGRRVHLVDGTTSSMPDTEDNQAAYPQCSAQEVGLGFPLARLVVLMSLGTAMVKGMAMGPYAGKETGETALLRELLERLDSGDVLLADRYYCSYFMIALLQERHIEFVVRLHQCRDFDFRRGRHLGPGDHIVRWTKPERPEWMDQATYERASAGFPHRVVGGGHDLDGRHSLHPEGDRRTLPPSLARGTRSAVDQDHDGDRCAALQESRDGASGDLELPVGIQLDSPEHAGSGPALGPLAATVEFHGGAAEDRGRVGHHLRMRPPAPGKADRDSFGRHGGQPNRQST